LAGQGASRYWSRLRRLTGALLLLWLLVTLIAPWFARDLSAYRVFGFPLSFWLASQGTLLLYLVIVVAYVVLSERLDRESDA
jgi:putative solute:sodium symporter small subunit